MPKNADIQDSVRSDDHADSHGSDDFIRYLEAKKSVDDRSLNLHVWRKLREALQQAGSRKPVQVIEFGAGIGTMVDRFREWNLVPSFQYTMVELNPGCLAAFERRSRSAKGTTPKTDTGQGADDPTPSNGDEVRTIEALCADLYDVIADPLHRGCYDLITAHAVMDLLNLEEALRGFVAIAKPGALFYLSLIYDGHTELLPSGDPEFERSIFDRYHASMDRRESRGKPSGGSRAARAMFAHLASLKLPILAAGSSDWIVFPHAGRYKGQEAFFLHWIIDTIDNQLQRDSAVDPHRLAEWTRWRHAQIMAGELIFRARNMDFLVLRPAF